MLEIEACLLTQTSSKNLQEQTTETHAALTLSTRLRIHGSKKARVKSGMMLSDRNHHFDREHSKRQQEVAVSVPYILYCEDS